MANEARKKQDQTNYYKIQNMPKSIINVFNFKEIYEDIREYSLAI